MPPLAMSSGADDSSEPEPHLADCDWRFTEESSNRLADLALKSGTSVACLGTPRVFRALLSQGGRSRHLLWDHNSLWSNTFNKRALKIAHIAPSGVADREKQTFDVVVMDPPWYVAYYKSWLVTACILLRPGGEIIMPVFGPLLRPRGARQRHELARFIEAIGPSAWGISSVDYETPPFEREVLRAQGLQHFGNWRTAEIVRIRADRVPSAGDEAPAAPRWIRFVVRKQVVMLRRDCPSAKKLRLQPINSTYGFILRSVSSRNVHRDRANLWTSRNRIFRVSGGHQIASLLRCLAETDNWELATLQAELSPTERCALLPLREALEQ